MLSIHLYSEYLVNLRQISVFAALPSESNASTKVNFNRDTLYFELFHDGCQSSLVLPNKVTNLSAPAAPMGQKELSFRFTAAAPAAHFGNKDVETTKKELWTASDLVSGTRVLCNSCKSELVGAASRWKDLPSGGWAEMMDLWHCHKPTVSDPSDNLSFEGKGYSAGNALRPTPGCGLVDNSSFLFRSADCVGLLVRYIAFVSQSLCIVEFPGVKKVIRPFPTGFMSMSPIQTP